MWYSIVAVGPSGLLHSMRFPVELNTGSSEFSGFVAENYGGSSELKRTMMAGAADVLTVKGNNKLYLVEDWLNLMGWDKVYHRPRRHHAPTAAPIAVPAAVPTTAPAAALTTNNNHHHHHAPSLPPRGVVNNVVLFQRRVDPQHFCFVRRIQDIVARTEGERFLFQMMGFLPIS